MADQNYPLQSPVAGDGVGHLSIDNDTEAGPRMVVDNGSIRPDPFADVKAAIDLEDAVTDEEKDAFLTRLACEETAINFETDRILKSAVRMIEELSRTWPEAMKGYEPLAAQCRMLEANGITSDAFLALHMSLYRESPFFAPMRKFGHQYRIGPIAGTPSPS
jgi:hypothetical protein